MLQAAERLEYSIIRYSIGLEHDQNYYLENSSAPLIFRNLSV